ncbi:hypothetical protein E2986_11366 [Frieseomelitta varia]|uniref:CASAMP N-terminal domain-containing protein n=1 Tax=Frieseomelitta varia TaxID=561572 RepID=A0A833RSM4_9HYME|nr:hypothetical protein E2986_11366 [Frieseomelitta varia]
MCTHQKLVTLKCVPFATIQFPSKHISLRIAFLCNLMKLLLRQNKINKKENYCRNTGTNQEHLKPQIVHALSNAELYCLALANIYSDPNYHNQNHCGILQALARKGVYLAEPNNTQLTETILIQNSPLKMTKTINILIGKV